MRGSEKQIKWAEDIKESAFIAIGAMRGNFETMRERWNFSKNEDPYKLATDYCGYEPQDVDFVENAVKQAFDSTDEAAKIIEYRDNFTQTHLERLAKDARKARLAK